VTGMSRITGRDLYASQTSFLASHTLFITTNYLPTVNETDHGTWRRLCLFEFPFTFKAVPSGPRERPGDRGLKARLRGGARGQHDAIVTWLVEGAMRYLANRDALLDRPPAVAGAVDAWRSDADRILAYVTERLVPDSAGIIAKADLYWDFTAFLERGGHKPWSQELLFSRFRRHEKTSRAEWVRTQNLEVLSRPPLRAGTLWTSAMPSLEARPRCVTGFRFRTDTDERDDGES
jgi:putative DNA primase/helicase